MSVPCYLLELLNKSRKLPRRRLYVIASFFLIVVLSSVCGCVVRTAPSHHVVLVSFQVHYHRGHRSPLSALAMLLHLVHPPIHSHNHRFSLIFPSSVVVKSRVALSALVRWWRVVACRGRGVGVGKSCLLLQFTDKRFQPVHDLTIGECTSFFSSFSAVVLIKCGVWRRC